MPKCNCPVTIVFHNTSGEISKLLDRDDVVNFTFGNQLDAGLDEEARKFFAEKQ